MLRVIALIIASLVALLAVERAAEACCLGCACTKYKDRPKPDVAEPVYGYTRSVAGGIPRWSHARIAKFLATGTWKPITPSSLANAAKLDPRAHVIPAPAIQFMTADKAGSATRAHPVLIRRIEKHGSAILVEADERTFKLAPCPRKRSTTCLVDPGELALAPIPPPDAGDGFAKAPAPSTPTR
jgi:hypothetical protein